MLPLRLRKSPPSSPGLDRQLRSAAGDGQDGGAPRQTDAPADSSASGRGPGRATAARGPCCFKAQRSRALRSSAPRAPLLREEDRLPTGSHLPLDACARGGTPDPLVRPGLFPQPLFPPGLTKWAAEGEWVATGNGVRGPAHGPSVSPGASRLVRGVPFCPIPLTLRPHLDERERLPHWKMPDTCNCKVKWLLQHVSLVTRCLKSAWRDEVRGKNGERAAEPAPCRRLEWSSARSGAAHARRRRGLRVAGQRALGAFLI